MTEDQEKATRGGGYAAGEIAAIADVVAETLLADPDTASKGEALNGISRMARALSSRLHSISDPD